MMFRRLLTTITLTLSLAFGVALPAFAQSATPACSADPCTSAEVGPFMENIAQACGNTGDCTLCDMEIVVVNVGNWILGIVGALVLLFYVWGGIQWLASAGNSGRVKAGKESIKTATIGLIIIFCAYAAVYSLANALGVGVGGGTCAHTITSSPGVTGGPVSCSTNADVGKPCGTNSQCVPTAAGGSECKTLCAVQNNVDVASDLYSCEDVSSHADWAPNCSANKCDGGNNVQCCNLSAIGRAGTGGGSGPSPTDVCCTAGGITVGPVSPASCDAFINDSGAGSFIRRAPINGTCH